MRLFFGIDFDLRFDSGIRKKLLRFGARLSATPVVAPVNFFRHVVSKKSGSGSFDNVSRKASNNDNILKTKFNLFRAVCLANPQTEIK